MLRRVEEARGSSGNIRPGGPSIAATSSSRCVVARTSSPAVSHSRAARLEDPEAHHVLEEPDRAEGAALVREVRARDASLTSAARSARRRPATRCRTRCTPSRRLERRARRPRCRCRGWRGATTCTPARPVDSARAPVAADRATVPARARSRAQQARGQAERARSELVVPRAASSTLTQLRRRRVRVLGDRAAA